MASQRAGLLTASLLVDELRDGTKRAKVEHLQEMQNALPRRRRFAGQEGKSGSIAVYYVCSECGCAPM